MSQSPLGDRDASTPGGEPSAYAAGWSALSKSLRRGYSWSGNERNCAYLNTGPSGAPSTDSEGSKPGFANISAISGLDLNQDGRAAVALDWDHDGDLDLWLSSRSGPRLRLLRNELPVTRSVAIRPVGTATNRDGIGARVELQLDGAPWPALTRTRRAGEGILSQAGAWLHFGIGTATVAGCVVHWPGGQREIFEGIQGAGRFVLVEGSGTAAAEPDRSGPPIAVEGEPPAAPGTAGAARVILSSPRPVPALSVRTKDGRAARFLGVKRDGGSGTGAPILVLLWAQWCAPCIAELAQLRDGSAALGSAGINVLALSVDEPADQAAAAQRLERLGWPYSSGFATPEAISVLDVLAGSVIDSEERLALPSSFLIDADGQLIAVYRGPVDAAQVIADLAQIDADGSLAAATPFPGIWAAPAAEFDARGLAQRFERRGLDAPARELRLSLVEVQTISPVDFLLTRGMARLGQGDLKGAAEAFRNATASDPKSFEAHRQLGLALHRMGDAQGAFECYERALALDKSHDQTRFNMALALAQLERLPQARAQLAQLMARGSELAAELEARLDSVGEMGERP
ncbi:MAG: tetratricopeptide (TPR) repeat protein [Chlamydiales bacterium]